MALTLYHFQACPYCAKVRAVIDNLGVDIEMKDTRANDTFREELIALNGKTQVPCLVIDGEPMLESDAIVSYLEENHS